MLLEIHVEEIDPSHTGYLWGGKLEAEGQGKARSFVFIIWFLYMLHFVPCITHIHNNKIIDFSKIHSESSPKKDGWTSYRIQTIIITSILICWALNLYQPLYSSYLLHTLSYFLLKVILWSRFYHLYFRNEDTVTQRVFKSCLRLHNPHKAKLGFKPRLG